MRIISAAIALAFRLALMDVFFAGGVYAGTGGHKVERATVIRRNRGTPPRHLPSSCATSRSAEYFDRVFVPYYLSIVAARPAKSLIAADRLSVIGDQLPNDPDYFALANSGRCDSGSAKSSNGFDSTWADGSSSTIIGGRLGINGEHRRAADMLSMLAGH